MLNNEHLFSMTRISIQNYVCFIIPVLTLLLLQMNILALQGEFTNCSNKYVTICHEFSGVVEEVGGDVNNVNKGDRVGVDPNRCSVAQQL